MTRPLRVCHVMSADLWAGAEVQVATVASYLVERQEVELTAVLLNEGWLARELRGLGVPVTVVDEHEHGAIPTLTRLTRYFRDHRVQIVHTHRYKDNVLGSIAAKRAGVPHVIRTVHGLNEAMRGWTRAKLTAYDALDKAALRLFADRVIAVSSRIAETLDASGYGFPAVSRIQNGVDLRRVRATRAREDVRRELGVLPDACLIGTAGRLSPVKGHIHFLEAARLILRMERRARFIIVGGGSLKDELTASTRRLGIDEECLLVGPRADVLDLVGAMDIFVLPSLDEGVPMALLEAMALGRPVVASAVGGIPEVIGDRVTGLLVAPADERALAEACLELALDPERARALGNRARAVVEDRFSHQRNGEALLDVYRHVAGAAKPGLLHRARRKLDHALARRRMIRIHRDGIEARKALRSANSLLFVCHGNIIRSPFAARLAARALGDRHAAVSVGSGGLEAVAGKPAHPTAVRMAAELRIDLSRHAAALVTSQAVANADVIFVMDVPQLVALGKRFPGARAKTFLVTCLAPEAPLEIADPVDGDDSQFQACFDELIRAVPPLIRGLGDTGAEVEALMDKPSSVILLEFNELTPSLVARFTAEGKLPNFERFHDQSRVFTTDASEDAAEDKGLLNPWVQWVTVHTGVTAAEHGIRKLGEASRLRQKCLTELLTEAGRRLLIFGSMNVRYDERLSGCVVPDPWSTGAEPHPGELVPYHRFVQKTVQDHTSAQDGPSIAESLAFLRFMGAHGLSLSTVLAIARQLVAEVTGKYRWKRVAILDRIQWDAFRHYYRRIRPHFSTFFLNSTAHLQHRFWRNMDPGPFKIKPSAGEQPELQNAVLFGYQQMDELLGRFMKLAGDDAALILCTGLGQQPCLIYEDSGGKTFYRARSIDQLLEFARIEQPYAYFPVMSEEFHLKFEDEAQASRAARQLLSLTVGGEPALAVTQDGVGLFGGCRIFTQLAADAVLESGGTGSRTAFFDLFYQAEGIKSGMHHPDGMLWIRLPDHGHSVAREKVPLRAVAPTILRLLDLVPPEAMKAEPLLGSGRDPMARRMTGARLRRVS